MPENKISVSERFNDADDPDGYRWRIGHETGVIDEAGYQAVEAAVRKAIRPALPESVTPHDQRTAFLAEYAAWAAHRSTLSEAEEEGDYPAPGNWEDSDDTAVDLLRNVAKLLGAPE